MRSFAVYIFLFALISGGLCRRLPRQAPGIMGAPPQGVGASMTGAPDVVSTQDNKKIIMGKEDAKGVMTNDVFNQAKLGVPIDTDMMLAPFYRSVTTLEEKVVSQAFPETSQSLTGKRTIQTGVCPMCHNFASVTCPSPIKNTGQKFPDF